MEIRKENYDLYTPTKYYREVDYSNIKEFKKEMKEKKEEKEIFDSLPNKQDIPK